MKLETLMMTDAASALIVAGVIAQDTSLTTNGADTSVETAFVPLAPELRR